ncbi:MAG: ArgR family transcriptional regulator [Vagococcus sp.]
MRKKERQRWISKIIKENDVIKQEDLVALLIENNIPVTQATVSRDIKEMKLIKVLNDNHVYRYSLPQNDNSEETRLEKLLTKSFVRMERMDNLLSVVVKPGSGFALGGLIETVYPEYLFTVMSNDDKVLIITREDAGAIDIQEKIEEIVE